MDRLVDHLFVFEGEGDVRDFPGNYSQYRLALKDDTYNQQTLQSANTATQNETEQEIVNKKKRQLSFKEKREFELLEKEIAALSNEKASITEKLSSSSTAFDELQLLSVRIGELTQQLDSKELRWLELSEMAE
jgi:ATP-binding cassette subfamily F protein uup